MVKTTETLVWIMYDVVENKPRTKIAKHCKEAGLYRVQKSVFWAPLSVIDLMN
jgi:CRISPR-associated protein Cas2